MNPFKLEIPSQEIDDLGQRLRSRRLPDQAPAGPWAYGTDVDFLDSLCAYWEDGFDWRAQEARLNRHEQFKTEINGIDLHVLHAPGNSAGGVTPMPLLLCHGWPGSVFEFSHLIDRLTDPASFGGRAEDAFTVIAPSLPGYTLSFQPGQRRVGLAEMAEIFSTLMIERFGYKRFGVQGGDWGSFVASMVGYQQPGETAGVHLNLLPLRRPENPEPRDEHERRYLQEELPKWIREETGYQWIQGTRPQTLAFGLNDSPAGLAAWIAEKFWAWTDHGGDPTDAVDRDDILAGISLYWFTQCIGASFWPYYERMHEAHPLPQGKTIDVPVGYTEFPREILRPPRSLAAGQYTNIQRWTEMGRGGHFAALEQPDALVAEIRAFFDPLR